MWITIIGWTVTLAAAIIPAFITRNKQKRLELDISELKKVRANSIDKFQFLEERPHLIKKLEQYEAAFDRGVNGTSTLSGLSRLLIRIDSYANRLGFSKNEKSIISSYSKKISDILESNGNGSTDLSSTDLEKIKVILEKGDNLQ